MFLGDVLTTWYVNNLQWARQMWVMENRGTSQKESRFYTHFMPNNDGSKQ